MRVLVSALWLSIAGSSSNLVAQRSFSVDGLSGNVSPSFSSEQLVFYPGDIVSIRIVRANLLFYSYQIILNREQKLVQSYSIVGVENGYASKQLREPPDEAALALISGDVIGELFKKVVGLQDELRRRQDKLMRFYDDPALVIRNDGSWSGSLRDEVKKWPSTSEKLRDVFRDITRQLETLYAQNLEIVYKPARGDTILAKATIRLVETIKDHLGIASNDFRSIENVMMRWSRILAEHRRPVLVQKFRIDNGSRRYTVQVKRIAVHDPHLLDLGTEIDKSLDTTTMATISFEGHEKSRFNLSLGFSLIYRPESYSYGIVGMPGPDTTFIYKTQKTGNSQIAVKPLVLLGIYFRPVDDFDLHRPQFSLRNFMLTVGTELTLPVKTYVFGIGYDFPFGLVVSGGATIYDQVVPASGWPEGQQVSSTDRAAVNSSLPTESKSAVGYYLSLGFRPAIFDALYGLITSTSWK